MEKEYAVIVKRGVDIDEVDAELAASTGDDSIPNRSVDIANPRMGSRRMTHWMLTDEEAAALRLDPRIEAVEIPPDQRDDIQMRILARQSSDFTKPSAISQNYVNWALRRIVEATNVYGTGTTPPNSVYQYALDGTGVDVVIQDSGIEPNHPEWNDYNGNSRLQLIDWYTASGLTGTQNPNHYRDLDGHGTHCAGIVAGLTYGWAKGARIYSQKLIGLEAPADTGTGIPIADAFDAIRLWHLAKTNGRPTVVNMSWGYVSLASVDPDQGTYRGTPWTFTGQSNTVLWESYGIVPPTANGGLTRVFPARNVFADAEVEDMIDAGIHVCIAAGNDFYKADLSSGNDYNNNVLVNAGLIYYHRGSSPHSDRAFVVGNIDTETEAGVEVVSDSSTRGPAVNIWAPGTNIVSAMSNVNIYSDVATYPSNLAYRIGMLTGTSEASPQVAGLCALHLQAAPTLTPAELKTKITTEAKGVVYDTGTDTDYTNYTRALLGSTTKMAYSKYGRQPWNITGSVSIS